MICLQVQIQKQNRNPSNQDITIDTCMFDDFRSIENKISYAKTYFAF